MDVQAAAAFSGVALACAALIRVRRRRRGGAWHVTPRSLCEDLGVAPIRASPLRLWYSGAWLRLGAVYFGPESVDSSELHEYEVVERTTRTQAGVDGACCIARIFRANHPPSLLLVAVYRPGARAYSIEFPSGLVDAGETLEEAATRELHEETGYTASQCRISRTLGYCDPWKSNENEAFAILTVDGDAPENRVPSHEREGMEYMQTLLVPVGELRGRLVALAEQGAIVESKLVAFAQALEWTE